MAARIMPPELYWRLREMTKGCRAYSEFASAPTSLIYARFDANYARVRCRLAMIGMYRLMRDIAEPGFSITSFRMHWASSGKVPSYGLPEGYAEMCQYEARDWHLLDIAFDVHFTGFRLQDALRDDEDEKHRWYVTEWRQQQCRWLSTFDSAIYDDYIRLEFARRWDDSSRATTLMHFDAQFATRSWRILAGFDEHISISDLLLHTTQPVSAYHHCTTRPDLLRSMRRDFWYELFSWSVRTPHIFSIMIWWRAKDTTSHTLLLKEPRLPKHGCATQPAHWREHSTTWYGFPAMPAAPYGRRATTHYYISQRYDSERRCDATQLYERFNALFITISKSYPRCQCEAAQG